MTEYKKCPHCDSEIQAKAIKCKYCKEMIEEGKEEASQLAAAQRKEIPAETKSSNNMKLILTLSIAVVVVLLIAFPEAMGLILTLLAIPGFITTLIIIIVKTVTKRSVPKYIIVMLPVLLVIFIVGITVYSVVTDDTDKPVAEPETEPTELSEVGEYGDQNGWVFKKETVSVGNNPPQPEELGVVGVEFQDGPFIEGHDLVSFSRRWNTIVDDFEMEGLKIDEFELSYGKRAVEAACDLDDWLTVFVFTGYGSEYVNHAGVEWELDSAMIGDMVTGAWGALIYATIPGITDEEILDVISELGIFSMSMVELSDANITREIHGYEYYFYSTEWWGVFEILPIE